MGTRKVMIGTLWLLALCAPGLLGISACGDDDGQPPPTDASVDSGPDGWVGGQFTVKIFDQTDQAGDGVPLAGATVALDPPFADRIETVSDANGEVTFDAAAIDWSVGTASITAHKPGYALASQLGYQEQDLVDNEGTLIIGLVQLPTAGATALLTIDATNLDDQSADQVQVYPRFIGAAQPLGPPPLVIEVPANTPFQLSAVDFKAPGSRPTSLRGINQDILRYCVMDVPAITDATSTVTLDFVADDFDRTAVDGTWALPTDPNSPQRDFARFFGAIQDRASNRPIGFMSYSDLTPDGEAVDFTWVTFNLPDTGAPYALYALQFGQQSSVVTVDGLPTGGALDETFLELPSWIEPADIHSTRSLFAPIEWDPANAGVPNLLASYLILREGVVVWYVVTRETSLTLPQPPSSLDYEGELSGRGLTGLLRVAETDESSRFLVRWAEAPALHLAP